MQLRKNKDMSQTLELHKLKTDLTESVGFRAEALPLSPEEQKSFEALAAMAVAIDTPEYGAEVYYEAAKPNYRREFFRDGGKTASYAGSEEMLVSQIDFAVNRIGKTQNPLTGEEPGKPPHEWPAPGEQIEPFREGRFTTYNACDTGAILLQSIAALIERGDSGATVRYEQAIGQTVEYIHSHIDERGLFIEDPKFSGSTEKDGRKRKFGLRVTDWKDSVLNRKGNEEPNYPIVYSIAHFQNAQALQRIGYAIGDASLIETGLYMTEQGLAHLWRDDHFVTAMDEDGEVDQPSTDSLESLLYIPPSQLPAGYAERIEEYTSQLETAAGYRAGIPEDPEMEDQYHMKVWVHSQAELHAASSLHGLSRAQKITQRVRKYIDRDKGIYPEILDPETYQSCGNDKQLWVMGADLYLQNPSRSFLLWQPPTEERLSHSRERATHDLAHASLLNQL